MESTKWESTKWELDLNDEHEKNSLTRKLLAAGVCKTDTPDYCNRYRWFYGGFTYNYDCKKNMIFKTPCGLFAKYPSVIEGGSYMGIDWSIENDCVPVHCPYFQELKVCTLNHQYLEDKFENAGGIRECAVKITDEPYDYENSVERIYAEQKEFEKRKMQEFREKHNGVLCEYQLRYSRKTGTVKQEYDFNTCITMACEFCTLRQKNLKGKKVNIFYDVETKYVEKGEGLLPDEEKIIIKKNIKFTKHPITEELAKYILKDVEKHLQGMEEYKTGNYAYSNELRKFIVQSVTVKNVRAEYKIKHDIYEDLEYIKSGIDVSYADIEIKKAKQEKSNKRNKSRQKKIDKIEKLYIEQGDEGLGKMAFQFNKLCEKGELNIVKLKALRKQYLCQKEQEDLKQLSFFDDE